MTSRTRTSWLLGLLALGLLTSPALAQGTLTVTYTTQPHGGPYAPANVVAVWIEDPAGVFVKTIDRRAQTRRQHLVAWTAKAGTADADAVSGATRLNHTAPLTVTWDLRNKLGQQIVDGTYTIRMELADSNASQAAQNAQGTFTFMKNGTPSSQSGLTGGGFSNVSIVYAPVTSATCNNGTLDVGETCDPAGSCPTSCPASGDPCVVNALVGSAATCTAECELQALDTLECSGGAADNPNITGGCAAGTSPHLPLGLLALALIRRRRRR